jgi:hypothetical protein
MAKAKIKSTRIDDPSRFVVSDYHPYDRMEHEPGGRLYEPPPLAAPPPSSPDKKKRRRKIKQASRAYKRYTTDDNLVVKGVNGIKSGAWSNPLQAAKALADGAEGSSHDSTVDRLRKKIGAALEG